MAHAAMRSAAQAIDALPPSPAARGAALGAPVGLPGAVPGAPIAVVCFLLSGTESDIGRTTRAILEVAQVPVKDAVAVS